MPMHGQVGIFIGICWPKLFLSNFYTPKKKETEPRKLSLSRNSPAALDAPLARFAPAALKIFRHPGGVPIFDSDSEGGYQNFYGDSEGGYAFFTGTFPEKDHLPSQEILNSPLSSL